MIFCVSWERKKIFRERGQIKYERFPIKFIKPNSCFLHVFKAWTPKLELKSQLHNNLENCAQFRLPLKVYEKCRTKSRKSYVNIDHENLLILACLAIHSFLFHKFHKIIGSRFSIFVGDFNKVIGIYQYDMQNAALIKF